MGTTLCWTCSNARGDRCPWMALAVPVDGWEAIPTLIRSKPCGEGGECVYDSYEVHKCPLYSCENLTDPRKTATCGVCQRAFHPPYQWSKYCSPECRKEMNRIKNRAWMRKKTQQDMEAVQTAKAVQTTKVVRENTEE